MKPWVRIDEAAAPDGTPLVLQSRDGEFLLLAGGKPLMASDQHGSEDALATLGCRRIASVAGAVRAHRRSRHGLHASRGARCPATGRDRRRRRARAGGGGLESRPPRPARGPSASGPAGPRRGNRCRDCRTTEPGQVRRRAPRRGQRLGRVDHLDQRLALRRLGRGSAAHVADFERRPRDVARAWRTRSSRDDCASTGSRSWSSTCAAG